MKGWILQWKAKVPFLPNWTDFDVPGAIRLVSKLPLEAVWVVLLVFEKETRAPRLTFSVPGLKAKFTIETVFAPLALAVGSAASPRLTATRPTRRSARSAPRIQSMGRCIEVVMALDTKQMPGGFNRDRGRAIMGLPGRLAQLGEHSVYTRKVTGSSPVPPMWRTR